MVDLAETRAEESVAAELAVEVMGEMGRTKEEEAANAAVAAAAAAASAPAPATLCTAGMVAPLSLPARAAMTLMAARRKVPKREGLMCPGWDSTLRTSPIISPLPPFPPPLPAPPTKGVGLGLYTPGAAW